ncbi:MAG: hypothetical protein HYV09_29800 [Deltaproteobacteria bacterium]|nr:hypothetical protein [Deltaproteobacteria bacterium]
MRGRLVKRVAAATVIIGLLGVVSIAVAARIVTRRDTRRMLAEHEQQLRDHAAAFFEDQRAVAAAPPFAFAVGARDAGPWLNARVPWMGKQSLIDEWSKSIDPTITRPEVPRPLAERLGAWGTRWVDHADDAELGALDGAWFDALSAYDHWDVDEHGPAADVTRYALHERPIPGTFQFAVWSKIRLLQGLKSGDARPAARAVRHVASLLHSTETSLGASMAVTLLSIERSALDKQRALGGDVTGWSVLDDAAFERLRRLTFAYRAFASVHAPSDLAAKAFEPKEGGWMRCAAIAEGVGEALMVRWYLEEPLRTKYDELAALLRGSEGQCRLRSLRKAWSQWPDAWGAYTGSRRELCSTLSLDGSASTPPVCIPWLFTRLVPGAREDVGHILASLSSEGTLSVYAKK